MNVDGLLTAIAPKLKELLPALRTCDTHGGRFDLAELEAVSAQTPAAFIAFLNVKSTSENGDGTVALNCLFSVYFVTTDKKGLDRSTAGRNLVEAACAWLPNNRFGLTGIGAPLAITGANLYDGKARGHAVSLWAVAWEQVVKAGTSDFVDGVMPENLYINEELQET
jgi:phage gp37-like protein